jgi:hypothetical protein
MNKGTAMHHLYKIPPFGGSDQLQGTERSGDKPWSVCDGNPGFGIAPFLNMEKDNGF